MFINGASFFDPKAFEKGIFRGTVLSLSERSYMGIGKCGSLFYKCLFVSGSRTKDEWEGATALAPIGKSRCWEQQRYYLSLL